MSITHKQICICIFICGSVSERQLVMTALTAKGKVVKKRKRQRSTKPGKDEDEKEVELPCPVCRTSIVSKPILVRSLRAAVEAVSAATQAMHAAQANVPGPPGDEAAAKAAALDLLAVQNELADRAERRSEWATLRKTKPVRLGLNEDGEVRTACCLLLTPCSLPLAPSSKVITCQTRWLMRNLLFVDCATVRWRGT